MDVEIVLLALHDGICKRKGKCKDRVAHAERIRQYMNPEPLGFLLLNVSK